MANTLTLKDAIQAAKENPNSDFATALRIKISNGSLDRAAVQQGFDLSPYGRPTLDQMQQTFLAEQQVTVEPQQDGDSFLVEKAKDVALSPIGTPFMGTDFGVGITKSGMQTGLGIARLAERGVQRLRGNRGLGERSPLNPETETGAKIEEFVTPEGPGEKAGKLAADVGQFMIPAPGGKVATSSKLFNTVVKYLGKAGRSGAVATAQEGEVGPQTIVAAGAEIVLPAGFKLADEVIGRLFTRSNSVINRLLSGAGANVDEIQKNPQKFEEFWNKLKKADKDEIAKSIDDDARAIINGTKKIRKNAGREFEKNLASLADEQLNVSTVRQNMTPVFDNYGISKVDDVIKLDNVEFGDSSVAMKRAQKIVDDVDSIESLDGKSLRNLVKSIESKKFRAPGGDGNKLAFNAFADDVNRGLRDSIAETTPKFQEMNSAYNQKMQIVNNMESIFGKSPYGAQADVVRKTSEKLPTQLKKGGLTERDIDAFLVEVGEDPAALRARQVVRETLDEPLKPETPGGNPFEWVRQATAGLIGPDDATALSIRLQKLSSEQQRSVYNLFTESNAAGKAFLIEVLTEILPE